MPGQQDLVKREQLALSVVVALTVFYVVAVVLLLAVWDLSGWQTAAMGFVALTGPAALALVFYRWTVS